MSALTPGQRMHAVHAKQFKPNGWLDEYPTWDDYDEAGRVQWEQMAADFTTSAPSDQIDDKLAAISHFFGRKAVRLAVPGAIAGAQTIAVDFEDGSTVSVEAPSVDEAWQRLSEAAKVVNPAPSPPKDREARRLEIAKFLVPLLYPNLAALDPASDFLKAYDYGPETQLGRAIDLIMGGEVDNG